jgi:DNA-binding beta-propeller fold protein YncE
VTRVDLKVTDHGGVQVTGLTRIAHGYLSACNAAALVVGPTGLAYDAEEDILYVASTGDNMIFAIPNARTTLHDVDKGQLIYQDNVHLHGPLALALAPNGHLLTANGDAINADVNQPSEIVEFTKTGQFVTQLSIDNSGEGGAFGLAVKSFEDEIRFAAVDDIVNALDIFVVKK